MTAAAASSGCHGTPILRTITKSSGALRTSRHLRRHRHAAARQRKHDRVGKRFGGNGIGESLARRLAVLENGVNDLMRLLQMESKPIASRLNDLIKGTWFLEQMGRPRDDMQGS